MPKTSFREGRSRVSLQQLDKTQNVAQGRVQIVGDGITEGFQLFRAFSDPLLKFPMKTEVLSFCELTIRDVADVALNHGPITVVVDRADELHGDVAITPFF